MNSYSILRFITGWFPPSFFFIRNMLVRISSDVWYTLLMVHFYNFLISFSITCLCIFDICTERGVLTWWRIQIKGILYPFTIDKISWFFIKTSLREKRPYSEFFWSIFSPYSDQIRRDTSPYSVRMQEDMDQKNSEYGHLLRSAYLIPCWNKKVLLSVVLLGDFLLINLLLMSEHVLVCSTKSLLVFC